MSKLDFLKPLVARAPKLLKKAGEIIDAHGDGDGVVEVSDVVDTVKDAASHVIDVITDIFD